jgi:hypothetical protein
MPTNHRIDIKRLGKRISALSDVLAKLGRGKDLRDLIRILRFPGWTTPAEFAFALGIVESMISDAAVLAQLQSALIKGSKAVATK